MNDQLTQAMAELAASPGKMDFRGKQYSPVALRVEMMRKAFGLDLSIETDIYAIDDRQVIVKATVRDSEGRVISTGFAEEVRSAKGVNSTSALENGETSAIGRALAGLGLGGGEFASADELTGALSQQKAAEARTQLQEAIERHSASIDAIRLGIAEGNLSAAHEAWAELSDEEKMSIWVAPSKGGPFTTQEREIMKSTEFREA